MTINEVINQIYSLSVAGYFNGEKFSKREFAEYVKGVFRPELNTTRWLMEIALPDGRSRLIHLPLSLREQRSKPVSRLTAEQSLRRRSSA